MTNLCKYSEYTLDDIARDAVRSQRNFYNQLVDFNVRLYDKQYPDTRPYRTLSNREILRRDKDRVILYGWRFTTRGSQQHVVGYLKNGNLWETSGIVEICFDYLSNHRNTTAWIVPKQQLNDSRRFIEVKTRSGHYYRLPINSWGIGLTSMYEESWVNFNGCYDVEDPVMNGINVIDVENPHISNRSWRKGSHTAYYLFGHSPNGYDIQSMRINSMVFCKEEHSEELTVYFISNGGFKYRVLNLDFLYGVSIRV